MTRARLTQIMNLLNLAPDIQEQILFLPATERVRNAITEKQLRQIAAAPSWKKQRRMWRPRGENSKGRLVKPRIVGRKTSCAVKMTMLSTIWRFS